MAALINGGVWEGANKIKVSGKLEEVPVDVVVSARVETETLSRHKQFRVIGCSLYILVKL